MVLVLCGNGVVWCSSGMAIVWHGSGMVVVSCGAGMAWKAMVWQGMVATWYGMVLLSKVLCY